MNFVGWHFNNLPVAAVVCICQNSLASILMIIAFRSMLIFLKTNKKIPNIYLIIISMLKGLEIATSAIFFEIDKNKMN